MEHALALFPQGKGARLGLNPQAQELVGTVAVFKLSADDAQHAASTLAPTRSHQGGGARLLSASPARQAPTLLTTASVTNDAAASHGINLDNAIQAHADWRTKLRAAASRNEQVDAETIGRDDCCELGKWLHGAGGSKFGGKPSFVALIAAHQKFHQEAAKVARVVNVGNGAQAEQMLGSGTGFTSASNEVGRLIVQLKGELKNAGNSSARASAPKAGAQASGNEEWESF